MKDDPASMLNRLLWLLAEDCELVGGVKSRVNVNCPSAGVVYRDMKSMEKAN